MSPSRRSPVGLRPLVRVAMLMFVTSFCVLACSVVAGLGPEAHPGTPTCGHTVAPGDRCSQCVNEHCCGEAERCSKDPQCEPLLTCLDECSFQFDCTTECSRRGASLKTYEDVTQCSIEQCVKARPDCLPGPQCNALGACCVRIADRAARTACASFTSALEENDCLAKQPLFCGIADAGSD